MATKITDQEMTSDRTQHTAQATDGGWSVTWLPGRLLTRNEAITAMTIAETVGDVPGDEPRSSARLWPHIEGWAAELGIDTMDAVALASFPPAWHRPM